MVHAKNAFNQGSIIHTDSSMLVSFESEVFTDDNAAKKVFWGEKANPHFIALLQMPNIPRTLKIQTSDIFQKLHFVYTFGPKIHSAQALFKNKQNVFWILSEIDVPNSL